MGASTVQTQHGRTNVPGVYSEVTTRGIALAQPGSKALFLVGEAEGGEPGVVHTITRPGQARDLLRSGDLLNAALIAFDPARSKKITGRAPTIHLYKTNPATQSAVTLPNIDGDALTLTSRDYGLFTTRIGATVGLGTTEGYKLTLALDELLESGDDLGALAKLTATHSGEASSMRLSVSATQAALAFDADLPGSTAVDAHVTGAVDIVSASAYDAHQTITIYGLTAVNAPISETIALNGVTEVTTALATFARVTGYSLSSANRGAVSLKSNADDTPIGAIAAIMTTDLTGLLQVVSADDADDMLVLIRGLDVGGSPVQETIALNGTTAAAGLVNFSKVFGAEILGGTAPAGNVSIQTSAPVVGLVIPAGETSIGYAQRYNLYLPQLAFASTIAAILDAAQAGAFIVVRGFDAAGAPAAEYLAINEAATVDTTTVWSRVTHFELGGLEAARTVTISATAVTILYSAVPKLRDVAARLSDVPGVTATALTDGAYLAANLDEQGRELDGVTASFTASLADIIDWINANSTLVTAARAAGATGAPSVTASREYLTGGIDGTTTTAHWRAALTASKAVSADPSFAASRLLLVPLSTSAAVHNLFIGHLREMDGIHERGLYVGLATALDKAGIKAAIRVLNNRQCNVTAQQLRAYDDDGNEATYPAWAFAAALASMQAGSPVGTPLTNALVNAIGETHDTSWDPNDDVQEMIAAGLIVLQGRKVVRSVTSYGEDDNPFYTELSTNEGVDDSIFNIRRALAPKIGERNFDGAASTVRTMAIAELQRQASEGEIKSFNVDSVVVEDFGDGFDLEYEVEPIEPINFILPRASVQRLSTRLAA